ncbi:Dyp-type peroxidase [Spelaeicoccus albus]|uniref:Deferrochelatase/peroxidase EfeB n=1 Tax=Spelaeicoccus albus TaxID=1280376 RepID=A0A7Z0D2G8_9MICO|nr:Dyp-type peroxidase [Spelaeicoccus albus]NYI67645.1 deferrochelatase/peroxidase EfeB [Spelaeicoccus albus]
MAGRREQADGDSGTTSRLSRRGFFTGAAGGLAAGGLAGVGGTLAAGAVEGPGSSGQQSNSDLTYSFYGSGPQAGVRTPPQQYCVFMTFDLQIETARELQVLLATWSGAIDRLMSGKAIGSVEPSRSSAVPTDTGEAQELGPNGLTVTLGLGPGVFDKRFDLAAMKPALLADLPSLPSDQLRAELTGGDISLQACADHPQVAYHAIRDLARMARESVHTRWTVMGFGKASAGAGQKTPRNLLGFKDGTRNITEKSDYDDFVWLGKDAGWMAGGTYQIARKIQMNIEIWDADHIGDQQDVFGRTKHVGAPLTGKHEFDTPDFAKKKADGDPVIPATSHIALAAHENNDGIKILRRPYNYTDGISRFGQLDAGLLFMVYTNDPDNFSRLQRKLGASDRLNEYIGHIGSAVFAVPPAVKSGHYLAEELFG